MKLDATSGKMVKVRQTDKSMFGGEDLTPAEIRSSDKSGTTPKFIGVEEPPRLSAAYNIKKQIRNPSSSKVSSAKSSINEINFK